MVLNRTIQIRLTKEQYELIKNNSCIKGFSSLSAYLRYVALNQDFVLHQRILEIHNHLLGEQPGRKFKKNGAYQPFL